MKRFTIPLMVCLFLFINHANAQTFTNYTVPPTSTASGCIKAIAIDKEGNKWFGTTGGVLKFDGTNWTNYDTLYAGENVNAVAIDAEGNKWFGFGGMQTSGRGVSKFDGTNWTNYFDLSWVFAIYIDTLDNKWFGCGTIFHWGGVLMLKDTTWTNYSSADGLGEGWVYAIAIDAEDNKWFGTCGGVSKFDDTIWTTFTTEDGLLCNCVGSIAIDGEGNKWFGFGDCGGGLGVSKFDDTTWTTYTTENGLVNNHVNAIAIDAEGNKWFGTEGGVSKFNDNTWTTYDTLDGLVDNHVTAIAIDAEGNIWFGTTGGVSKLSAEVTGKVINVPAGQPTIQAGIDAATTGDTVLVAEGTYYENINFMGKAITVASQFILDGDTSHISKTIIDGSKSTNPDTASVVTMWSGEDTTSVLMGFTITGGKGTIISSYYGQPIINLVHGGSSTQLTHQRVGGGIFITGSGGKITNNIIEKNHVADSVSQNPQFGGGIHANVYNNHSLIIRKNILRDNTVTGHAPCGGGISAVGGRIICENNEITNNTLDGLIISLGGGMLGLWFDAIYGTTFYPGVIKEAIIRNNRICADTANSDWENGGGAYAQLDGYGEEHILVYNNIICNNYSNAGGGALAFHHNSEGRFFNNTIVNNTAGWDANCLEVANPKHIFLYNNILYRYVPSTKKEYWIGWTEPGNLQFFNNILLQPFTNQDPVTAFNNLYAEPVFQPGSYELAEGSPGIGWGRDSFAIGSTWYYAPATDLFGNKRPDPVDPYVDAGAVESAFPRPVYHNANLTHIGLWNQKLWPDFHEDTLHYILPVPDTTVVTPQLDVVTEDWVAEVDIDNADNIGSADPADRTTTITVTADDGTTQKIYTVLFRYASTDVTLSNLSISKGTLAPEFQPDSLVYTVCLPQDEKVAPAVNCESTDSNATIHVKYAPNITIPDPWNKYREYRTTVITVIAEDMIHKAEYEIEHLIDKTVPAITLADDTVILNESIAFTSTEDGNIYLVPVNTSENLDSIMVHWIDKAIVKAGVTAYIDTAVTGTYWLYAIDNCLNISKAVEVIIVGMCKTISEFVRIYPIPVDRILYIETTKSIASVELFNIIGVKVLDKSEPEGHIDMDNLEQGIYFIRIKTAKGEVYTGKVIKE